MKVNLLLGGHPLNGYLNIDPLAQQQDGKFQQNIDDLDSVLDNNECAEFLAHGVIDTFPLQVRKKVLEHWMSKVEHGGVFVISGTDIHKLSRVIASGSIDLLNANYGLFGTCSNMWLVKKGIWSMQDAIDIILGSGQFKILSKEYMGLNYIVKAQRL